MAEAALAAKDYERFHDLAWAAYRKGKSTDPESMLLVARAQSLSGRPLDALVMLERIATLGAATDAPTSDDFARVRALPRWPDVAEKLGAPSTTKAPASSAKDPAPPAKAPAPAKDPAPPAKDTAPPAKDPAPSAKAPTPSAKAPAPSAKSPLLFTTVLTPDALAYDAVSRRYIIADRKARRIAVVDENTGQVATLVGALGALGEIGGMAIDSREGDLWVVSTGDEGPQLHRMQLISGRVLSTVALDVPDAIVGVAHVRDAGLVVAAADGTVWRVRRDGKAQKLIALEYVPRGLAADAQGRLYVAGGTARLARFAVATSMRKIDTIEIDPSIPHDAPFGVTGSRLFFVVASQGSFEIKTVPVK